jgi:tetratricopeptide (TPR) repeat protein
MRCLGLLRTNLALFLVMIGFGCSKPPSGPAPTLPSFPTDFGQSKSLAWKEYLDRGNDLVAKGKYDEAVVELTKAIKLGPELAELFVCRNDAYRGLRQWDKAIADCDKAISLQPDYLEAYLQRGYSFAEKHDYDKAILDLTRVIDSKKEIPSSAFSVRGQCWQAKGDALKAINDYSAALTLEPKDADTLKRRGDAHLSGGNLAAAISDYTEVLKLKPGEVPILLSRGEAYVLSHDYKSALADAEDAIKHAEKNAAGHSLRAWAYIGLHENGKAVSDFTRAIELDPKNAVHYGDRGRCLANLLHDYDKALADHNKAIELGPKDALLYYERGKTWFAKRDLKAALVDFDTAIELNRQLFVAWLGRAEVLTKLKDVDAIRDVLETIKLCDEEIRQRPKNEVAYLFRGYARMLQGQYDKALADIEQAGLLDPNSMDVYKALAWIQATSPEARYRDGNKAVINGTKACELSKWKDAEYLDVLAAAYAEAGQFEEAVHRAKQALGLAWAEFRPELAARLELYLAKKPYRAE